MSYLDIASLVFEALDAMVIQAGVFCHGCVQVESTPAVGISSERQGTVSTLLSSERGAARRRGAGKEESELRLPYFLSWDPTQTTSLLQYLQNNKIIKVHLCTIGIVNVWHVCSCKM